MKPSKSIRSVAVALSSSIVAGASGLLVPQSGMAQTASEPVIELNQAWSQGDREWYWSFSQGGAVIAYDIFLNLEVTGGQDLFRSDANLVRYGLIPNSANSQNPDGLPIGISKATLATPIKGRRAGDYRGIWPAGDYIGFTCAACHTGQLRYKGKFILIEGGVNNALDLQGLVRGLDDALRTTLTDAAKFDRLASRLGASSPDAKDKLRKQVESESDRMHVYNTREMISRYPFGPGRIDALALIFTRMLGQLPGIPENANLSKAPVKPPFLWNAPQGLWTQWRGAQQDPISRNIQESLAVWLAIDLSSKSPAEGLFQSSIPILNMQRVEDQLERLAPPSWPEDVLGKIDRDKAKVGKARFVEFCASCHSVWPYRWTEPNKYGKSYILVGLTPQTYVGTDGTYFETNPFSITGELSNYLPPEFKGKPILPTLAFFAAISRPVVDTAVRNANLTEAQELDLRGYRYPGGGISTGAPPDQVFKAAPRDGVWATAPFLHNGSVPNLYEMLIPAAERTKKFYLGGDFDPVRVGLDTSATSGTFLMDTTLPGNSNAGHSFENGPRGNGVIGPLLPEDDRWALVEYLKSIPEEAGRVTPFGGPPPTSSPQKQ